MTFASSGLHSAAAGLLLLGLLLGVDGVLL